MPRRLRTAALIAASCALLAGACTGTAASAPSASATASGDYYLRTYPPASDVVILKRVSGYELAAWVSKADSLCIGWFKDAGSSNRAQDQAACTPDTFGLNSADTSPTVFTLLPALTAPGAETRFVEVGFTRGTVARVRVAATGGYLAATVRALGAGMDAGVYAVTLPTPTGDSTSTAAHEIIGYDASGKVVATLG